MARTAALATTSMRRLRRAERAYRELAQTSASVVATSRRSDAELTRSDPEISGWTAAEHLEHLGRSDLLTYDRLDEIFADPVRGEPVHPSLAGRLVLSLGWIPRGRGQSPDPVRPTTADVETARELTSRAQLRLESYGGHLEAFVDCPTGLRHPYFGVLDPPSWLRFLAVHHRHHLKIVRDLGVPVS